MPATEYYSPRSYVDGGRSHRSVCNTRHSTALQSAVPEIIPNKPSAIPSSHENYHQYGASSRNHYYNDRPQTALLPSEAPSRNKSHMTKSKSIMTHQDELVEYINASAMLLDHRTGSID